MLSARLAAAQIKPNLTNPPPGHRSFAGARIPGSLKTNGPANCNRLNRIGVRAVISGGGRATESTAPTAKKPDVNGSVFGSMNGPTSAGVKVTAAVVIRKKVRENLVDKLEGVQRSFTNAIGQGILVQLISEDVDHETKAGKSVECCVTEWAPISTENPHIVKYNVSFEVPKDFGKPRAFRVTNNHSKEFYLVEIVLHGLGEDPIYFPANSWIQPRYLNCESRIIFRNQAYLPSQTPLGIRGLRHEDLGSIRGNGKPERKIHERVYDYAPYNDLGNPDKGELARPVLAGKERPYPRRCRSGRSPMKSDPDCEVRVEKPGYVYVPRDEAFEETKKATFEAGRKRGEWHNMIPQIKASLSTSDVSFTSFSDIDNLYNDSFILRDEETVGKPKLPVLQGIIDKASGIINKLFKYDIPAIIKRDRIAWMRDNEFARQALAGLNPVSIQLLKEFPIVSKLDPGAYGPPESVLTEEVLEQEMNGMSVKEAIKRKKLFMIDYHDLLLPFVNKINYLQGRKAYASRTIFYLSDSGVLKPIAIELSLPPTDSSPSFKRVYTHGHDATTHWLWNLAKAHVCAVDGGVHQLVNHWLRTHACMEPYIIATHRQLSSMHPVYKLLHPHMRYTLEMNALARQRLINGGGIIEDCFTPGRYAMELSSAAYKSNWRFDREGLPADLLHRGMAVEDDSSPCGIKLVIEDYPYAADGLLVWSAIKEYVTSYIVHFYTEPNSVTTDIELQEWWKEIKNKGHPEKKHEPWWPKLNTKKDLVEILTTMIWIASGQHAALNFGQYPFGGYVLYRPTLMRKLIPQEGGAEYERFLLNPQQTFLSALPTCLQATKIMAVQETLSEHSADEEYLGEEYVSHTHWINDQVAQDMFTEFSGKIKEIEKIVNRRNQDSKNKNRCGAGIPPYELLLPTSEQGVTGRGIPNSISI